MWLNIEKLKSGDSEITHGRSTVWDSAPVQRRIPSYVSPRSLKINSKLNANFHSVNKEPVDWADNQDCDLHSTAILAQHAYKGIDFYFVVFEALAEGAVTIKYGWTPASYIGEYLKAEW